MLLKIHLAPSKISILLGMTRAGGGGRFDVVEKALDREDWHKTFNAEKGGELRHRKKIGM